MNVARCESSMLTSSRQTRASAPRAITMSLSAIMPFRRSRRRRRGGSVPRAPSAPRAGSAPSAIRARTASSSSASTFDRKPILPRFTPSSGTSTSATARAARRNVPSPPSTNSTSVFGSSVAQRVDVAGRGGPLLDAVHVAPAGGPLAQLERRLVRRVVGEADAHRQAPPGVPAQAASTARSITLVQLRARRPGPEVREELAVALRPLDRRGDDVPRAEPEVARLRGDPPEHARVDLADRGPRHGPPGPRPASNCGLTSATMSAGPGASVDADGPEHEAERDERHVERDEADRLGEGVRRSGSGRSSVPSTRRGGPGAATRRAGRARRRARRRGCAPRCSRTSVKPPVDAPTSRQTRPVGSISNASSAAASLWPPRETYGSRSTRSSGVVGSTRSPGLRSRRAASPSPTRTLPASTSACARVRVSTRPRSTRSWSSRTRGRLAVAGLTRLSWHSGLHRGSTGRRVHPRAVSDCRIPPAAG